MWLWLLAACHLYTLNCQVLLTVRLPAAVDVSWLLSALHLSSRTFITNFYKPSQPLMLPTSLRAATGIAHHAADM